MTKIIVLTTVLLLSVLGVAVTLYSLSHEWRLHCVTKRDCSMVVGSLNLYLASFFASFKGLRNFNTPFQKNIFSKKKKNHWDFCMYYMLLRFNIRLCFGLGRIIAALCGSSSLANKLCHIMWQIIPWDINWWAFNSSSLKLAQVSEVARVVR